MKVRAPSEAEIRASFSPDLSDGRMSFAAMMGKFARGPSGQLLPQNSERLQLVYREAGVKYGEPLTLDQYVAGLTGAWVIWASPTRSSLLPIAALAAAALWFMHRRR